MNKGIIIKINKAIYFVKLSNNEVLQCTIRGKLISTKNTIVVGDFVNVDTTKKTIESVLERKNKLIRPEIANIDKLLIVCSTKIPAFSTYLLDKFLVLSHLNNIEPIIIITKTDLLKFKQKIKINKYIRYYKHLGYKVYKSNQISNIKKEIRGNISALAGQTGAGKSTLLNKLNKNYNLKTDEVSLSLGRGKHTTRLVELLDFDTGLIADTPGFSSLELGIAKEDIKKGFVEFDNSCKYRSCNHIKEDGCKIIKKVNDNKIAKFRYENYLKLMGE